MDFGGFYDKEYAAVVGLVFALRGERTVAEDLAQDAFLAAHRRWHKVSGYDRPDAWVRRVAVNLARSRWRRLRVEARALARLGARSDGSPVLLPADTATFWEAVRALPRRQAQVVALYYGEDRSVGDVAVILGLAEGTVRALLHQGRASLAARIGEDR